MASGTSSRKLAEPSSSVDIDSIRALPFFQNFPDNLLQQIALVSTHLQCSKGHKILEQGQRNSNLYFLLSGQVSVFVDGGLVAHLNQRGDLLGEMSVISESPCAASIIADGDVELLCLDANDFQQISGQHSQHLENNLYRIYALILAERVRVTNEKAKHFEQLSRSLEAAKAELQSLSHKKLEEMYSTRKVAFEKLENVYRRSLLPLREKLDQLSTQLDTEAAQLVRKGKADLDQVIDFLEPMTSLYNVEKAMRAKKVLVMDSTKKQQVIAKLALGGTGVELDIVSNPDELEANLRQGKSYDIIFFDSGLLDRLEALQAKMPHVQFVFMTSESIPTFLEKIKGKSFLPNIVSRDENDRTFTIKNIMTTASKLASQDIFGLEKYLAWGVDVHEVEVRRSDEREKLIGEMDAYFGGLGLRKTIRERCNSVTEELLMNAIYDAPKDAQGQALYNHMSRKELIELKPEHYGQMRYASDGMLLAVSVSDPFGGLTAKIIMSYLDSCYGGRAGELNEGKGGAGRGLHLIIENSDLVVFNVQGGVKTEVIALFNVDPKQIGEKSSSLHYFCC